MAAGGLLAGGAEQHSLLEGVHPLHGTQLFGACGLGESSKDRGIGAVLSIVFVLDEERRQTMLHLPIQEQLTAASARLKLDGGVHARADSFATPSWFQM